MRIIENIRLALAGLKAGKMRALLTMLGIIIGIGSVIAIVTMGNSLSAAMTDQMGALGVNNINVNLRLRTPAGSGGGGVTDRDRITVDMINTLMDRYPDDIEAVSLTHNAGAGTARYGRLDANVTLLGVNPGYMLADNTTLLEGRFITDRDMQGARNVAVVSHRLVENVFPDRYSVLGEEIRVHTHDRILTFSIIGVYEHEAFAFMGPMANQDIRTNMFIPVTTAQTLTGAGRNFQSFTLVASQTASPTIFTADVERFFERYYGPESRFEVVAMSMESMLDMMTDMLSTVQTAIAAIAAISLLVGGIGVMNIMLVSVTERTREIGTRKALGARNSAIRVQFIVESMIICLIGGIIGIVFGLILGMAGANLLEAPASPDTFSIVIAVAFSMMIGIFFGYYPANKAAKLDPIEALRYE